MLGWSLLCSLHVGRDTRNEEHIATVVRRSPLANIPCPSLARGLPKARDLPSFMSQQDFPCEFEAQMRCSSAAHLS